jgi:hypothetical protein
MVAAGGDGWIAISHHQCADEGVGRVIDTFADHLQEVTAHLS